MSAFRNRKVSRLADSENWELHSGIQFSNCHLFFSRANSEITHRARAGHWFIWVVVVM